MGLATLRTELEADRWEVDRYLRDLLATEAGSGNGLVQEAMRYAVMGPAQRVRPILALRIARMLDAPLELTMRAASAVELLHCASLIIDDLPCMDDSAERRNQPAVHVRFGEATAVLSAFGLVALSARILVECDADPMEREQLMQFQVRLLRSLDCAGLIAGQALDLRLANQRHLRTRRNVTELKTVPLFVLAVEAGALFSTIGPDEQAMLRCFGRQFGLAFQTTDDLLDGDEVEAAAVHENFTNMRAALSPFGSARRDLEELVDYLHARVADTVAS